VTIPPQHIYQAYRSLVVSKSHLALSTSYLGSLSCRRLDSYITIAGSQIAPVNDAFCLAVKGSDLCFMIYQWLCNIHDSHPLSLRHCPYCLAVTNLASVFDRGPFTQLLGMMTRLLRRGSTNGERFDTTA